MKLKEKQYLFAHLVALLILKARQLGFQPRGGEWWRHPSRKGGHPKSTHKNRCGIDLLLDDADGKWLTETEEYRQLGEWWEQQHELCRWGGRFDDGNHFSIEHDGVK